MSTDLTFLSNSYTQQILHQLRTATEQKAQKKKDFGSILSSKDTSALRRRQELENYYKQQLMTDRFRSDLFGEQTVLTDRGTDWLSAYAYLGGRIL